MIKEAIATGADVREAQEKARAQLGDRLPEQAEVQYETLELPKKKVLGLFGGCEAKVRAYYELPDDKPLKRVEKYQRAAEKHPPEKRVEKPKEPRQKPQQAAPAAAAAAVSAKPAPKEAPAEQAAAPAPEAKKLELQPIEDAAKQAVATAGEAFVRTVLEKMEIEATVKSGQLGNNVAIVLEGDHLGAIVGRRGETLDALQYLTMLVANRGEGEYQRITLNIGDYREKRERTLRALARRMANQALRTGRNVTLEPMNPYERRLIHTAVQEVEGVTSWSVGEEPGRRVVIGTEKGGRRGGGDRPRANRRREAAQPADPNREQKKDVDSAPLYGRIG